MKSRPRILYLTPYWPHRATCASELRAFHIGRALQDAGEVEVAVVGGEGFDEEWAEYPDKELKVALSMPVRPLPKQKGLGMKLRRLVDPYIPFPHGCGVTSEAMNRVRQAAGRFDMIWFNKLRIANMFPCYAWPHSVVDVDDVPSTYERSVFDCERGLFARFLAGARYWSWRRRDQRLGERFSVVGVCSEKDRHYLKTLGVRAPMHVIPNGFQRPSAEPVRKLGSPPRIGFIGIFDYEPNLDGIRWFAERCWPLVKREVPDARLRLVGRHSEGSLKPSGNDIDGLGWVEDSTQEIATWSAMIVPIRFGGGTRGKIAQGFGLKCPVISTSLGAYGYEAVDGRELYLADSAEEFANACIGAIRRPQEAAQVAERAWRKFLDRWTWDAIRPRVHAAAEECFRLSDQRPGMDCTPSQIVSRSV